MTPEVHPDSEVLLRHLNEELVGDDARSVNVHLSECSQCQSKLQSMAAGDPWWQALPSCLAMPSTRNDLAAGADSQLNSPDELWFVESQQIHNILSPTDDPNKIGRLGGYEISGIVGAGATAVVLKALDVALNRFVAIKLMRPTLAASPIARQRFAREARTAASIVHENVIEIHGVAEVDGLPYLVMPYIRGQSLAKRIDQSWPMATEAVLHIACQVADGLAAAHEKGLIHRDVKPSNILLGHGIERLKLTDFGLARAIDDVGLTRSGTLAGTPEYMSPEQARGGAIDHRSDLFSLGSVMYAMCTSRPPFSSDSCYGVLRKIIEEQPRPIHDFNPAVPDWMTRLIERLMEKDREQRIQSAPAVAGLLRKCLNHVSDPKHAVPEELQPIPKSSGRGNAYGFLIGIAAAALSAFALWSTHPFTTDPTSDAQMVPHSNAAPSDNVTERSETWDDGVAQVLDEIATEVNQLESVITFNP